MTAYKKVRNGEAFMKTVYVLGAGATRAVAPNMPLTNNLLPGILQSSDQSICLFLSDFYRFGSPEELPPIEDVLSQIDFAINENRPLSSKYSVQHMRELRENLIYNICKIVRGGKGIDFEAATKTVEGFIRHLPPDDCIVSMNYDLVTDTAIRRASDWKFVDYGFPVRNAVSHHAPPTEMDTYAPTMLYKLHGSLNWLFCPLCRAVDIVDGHHNDEHYIYEPQAHQVKRCHVCDVPYEPVIITPSFLKSYDNLYVSYMWRQAEQKLAEADRMVYIGYSMPDADMILRCMFRRAYFTHLDLFSTKSAVTVVGYAPNFDPTKPELDDTYTRYKHLFGEITYEAGGFLPFIAAMS